MQKLVTLIIDVEKPQRGNSGLEVVEHVESNQREIIEQDRDVKWLMRRCSGAICLSQLVLCNL
jgi:hypothetical protein